MKPDVINRVYRYYDDGLPSVYKLDVTPKSIISCKRKMRDGELDVEVTDHRFACDVFFQGYEISEVRYNNFKPRA